MIEECGFKLDANFETFTAVLFQMEVFCVVTP
jgi:hypothetical protein